MLFDFIRPSAGTYTVLGGRGADPAIRRRLGYIPPGELKFDPPRYTTADLIAFYGRLRGGVDTTYVDELLERFDLDPVRPIGQLSTGNRRKTAIVQAFMHRPELLILDEPTAGLDPLLQHEFHQLIGDVKRDGATVFLSSHVLPEVEALADRVGILRKGQLVTVAAIDQLQRQARQHVDLYLAREASAEPFADLPASSALRLPGRDQARHRGERRRRPQAGRDAAGAADRHPRDRSRGGLPQLVPGRAEPVRVLGRYLEDRRRSMVWWSGGVAAYVAVNNAFYRRSRT